MLARLAPAARLHETGARAAGYETVVGLDESGVGCIAGPLIAAAVVLPRDWDGMASDAKGIPRAERRAVFDALDQTQGLFWACGVASHAQVDELGPREALAAAMRVASTTVVRRLCRSSGISRPGLVYNLVDGEVVPSGLDGLAIVRGDQTEASIAAASIVASVVHECAMRALSRRWPLWELDVNVGWPSGQHVRHIATYGPSGCHRASCFPFQRRHGRRLAYHPERAAYLRVQRELERAARPPEEIDQLLRSEDDVLRARRYLAFHDYVSSTPSLSSMQAHAEGAGVRLAAGGSAGRGLPSRRSRRRARNQ